MNDKNLTPVLISGVSCYEQDGTAYLKLEDVARGLGFTEVAASGNECVRWRTVRKHLSDLGIATSCDGQLPDYIPENIFYRLAMKAKNETAEKFQALVADEIIPSIRKTGSYMMPKLSKEMQALQDTSIRMALRNVIHAQKNLNIARKNHKLCLDAREDTKNLLAQARALHAKRCDQERKAAQEERDWQNYLDAQLNRLQIVAVGLPEFDEIMNAALSSALPDMKETNRV